MLLRLGAMVMVEQAGFEGIAASDADEAIRILESPTDIKAVYRRSNAGCYERPRTGSCYQAPLASCRSHRDIGPK